MGIMSQHFESPRRDLVPCHEATVTWSSGTEMEQDPIEIGWG